MAPFLGCLNSLNKRAGLVTERKHYPDVDVAAAGGWKTPETMKLAYQHADAETMVAVVTEPRRLGEAR